MTSARFPLGYLTEITTRSYYEPEEGETTYITINKIAFAGPVFDANPLPDLNSPEFTAWLDAYLAA
jgi:hypothetical protein